MSLSLSSQNVIQYLQNAGLCSSEDGTANKSELTASHTRNLNFLVSLADDYQLLVKQENKDELDYSSHELFNEWQFHQLLQQFPVLGNIGEISSTALHFDLENSLLVRRYLVEYLELENFYYSHNIFPSEIPAAIGHALAGLHRATFQCREYRDFMATAPAGQFRYHYYNPAQGISSIIPEIFGTVPTEALKFYALYQSYESLESAIADLAYAWQPCCLIHNDLQLSNILVHSRWQQLDNCLVRLIDWEACCWGDPAFDLGTLLASYLKIWLTSLVVDPTLDLAESLNLAMVPLEILQPSILALFRAYFNTFPTILDQRQDFIQHVIQFAGLALIHQIKEIIEGYKYFNNSHLCMLETARKLLTMPEQSISSILGISESEMFKSIAEIHPSIQRKTEKQLIPIFYEKARLRGC